MIPARLGSQRLKQKNLRDLAGVPLVVGAMRRCRAAKRLNEVWVNSEADEIRALAEAEGIDFHSRPPELASEHATSEDFVYEFLTRHDCEYLVQVHSIAPLLPPPQIDAFVEAFQQSGADVMLSVVPEQIECLFDADPVNFTFERKENSQDLRPVHRVTWSITGWRRAPYLAAYDAGRCATYCGDTSIFEIDRESGHIIKTEDDLRLAEAVITSREETRA